MWAIEQEQPGFLQRLLCCIGCLGNGTPTPTTPIEQRCTKENKCARMMWQLLWAGQCVLQLALPWGAWEGAGKGVCAVGKTGKKHKSCSDSTCHGLEGSPIDLQNCSGWHLQVRWLVRPWLLPTQQGWGGLEGPSGTKSKGSQLLSV